MSIGDSRDHRRIASPKATFDGVRVTGLIGVGPTRQSDHQMPLSEIANFHVTLQRLL